MQRPGVELAGHTNQVVLRHVAGGRESSIISGGHMATAGYYFIRVNGSTGHNDPSKPEAYVPGEPPTWPERYFNYADYCLSNGFVRIGWPAAGDLSKVTRVPEYTDAYALKPHIRSYLVEFRDIAPGSVILMPDKDRSGVLYIGETTTPYFYSPTLPFECVHRLGVVWDRSKDRFAEYHAAALGIGTRGGFWMRAFQNLSRSQDVALIARINAARARSRA
jgi:hypothetical protein